MKRPVAVILVATVYLLIGTAGFIRHFPDLATGQSDAIAIEITEITAVVCGVYLLRRHNWARWLALWWVIFHVMLSLLHPLPELGLHAALCVLIAWALFRPATSAWFIHRPVSS